MFFDRFQELCAQRGVAPTKAAQEAGVNKSSVTYWRKNPDARPTGQVAQRLCDYFGITIGELYGESVGQAKTPVRGPRSTEEELRFALFGGLDGITDEMYEEVKRFAQFVKERDRDKG